MRVDAISQRRENGTLKGYCGKLTIIYSPNHITGSNVKYLLIFLLVLASS